MRTVTLRSFNRDPHVTEPTQIVRQPRGSLEVQLVGTLIPPDWSVVGGWHGDGGIVATRPARGVTRGPGASGRAGDGHPAGDLPDQGPT